MAWPVDAAFEVITAGVTTAKKTLADALQNALIGLYGGTKTVISIQADGTGNQASTANSGDVSSANGNVVAPNGNVSAGLALVGGKALITVARSSVTAGSGQSVALGEVWKDTTNFAAGVFTVSMAAIALTRGYNMAAPTYVGTGIFIIATQTAATHNLLPTVLILNDAPLVCHVRVSEAPGASGFHLRVEDLSGTLVDPFGFYVKIEAI